MLPSVVIVGRPNVGKSSLFNRLLGRRMAIVDPTPGVTRDRLEGFVAWCGKGFRLIDTGGMNFDDRLALQKEIQRQVDIALTQADVVLFLADAVEGPMALDFQIMEKLRRINKPLLLVANKADDARMESGTGNFYQFGVDKVYAVSALHGRGVGDLLDALLHLLPETTGVLPVAAMKIAILGKPNVGKSSFVNAVLKEDRVVVDDNPGTTRDAVDIRIAFDGKDIVLIDTAGIRRSKKYQSAPEFYSISRAKASIRLADVVILMLDAMEGISQQDRKLASMVQEEGKGMVLCLNKWDLVHGVDTKAYAKAFFGQVPFIRHCPLVYASAKENKNVEGCLKEALRVHAEAGKGIPTKTLNRAMERIQKKQSHPIIKGKRFKIFFAAQTGKNPPTFTLFVNDRDRMAETYLSFITTQLRQEFGFEGVPIQFAFRNRRDG